MKLTAFVDGSCLGNPGKAGFGFVIQDEEGNVLEEKGVYIGQGTNNIAEYRSMIGCLESMIKYSPEQVTVYADSQLMVNQINGVYKVKKLHLQELYSRAVSLIKEIPGRVVIEHIPREKNARADSLARTAVSKQEDINI